MNHGNCVPIGLRLPKRNSGDAGVQILDRRSSRFLTIQARISPPAAQVSPFAAGAYAWPELRCASRGSLIAFLQLQAVDFLALASDCVAPLNPQIEEKKLRRFCDGAGCEILLFQSESEGED